MARSRGRLELAWSQAIVELAPALNFVRALVTKAGREVRDISEVDGRLWQRINRRVLSIFEYIYLLINEASVVPSHQSVRQSSSPPVALLIFLVLVCAFHLSRSIRVSVIMSMQAVPHASLQFGIEIELLLGGRKKAHSSWKSLANDLSRRLAAAGIANHINDGGDKAVEHYREYSIVREVTIPNQLAKGLCTMSSLSTLCMEHC